jgi:hypothetical protein
MYALLTYYGESDLGKFAEYGREDGVHEKYTVR